MVIGKGGETIRGLESEYEVQDRHRRGRHDPRVRHRRPQGRRGGRGDRRPDEEPEVGDEYHNAKVVKTTHFGAFVELKKGTDGLLHVSNVAPAASVTSRT